MIDYHALALSAEDATRSLPPWARREAYRQTLADLLACAHRTEPPARPQPVPAPVLPPDTRVGVAEYLVGLPHIASHPQRVVALAYYVRQREGRGVTTQDVLTAYRAARIKAPQNVPDVIAAAMRRGLLIEAGAWDGRKCWTVTVTGERLVEERTG